MSDSFPFALEDIKSWIIRRKDGVVVKYTLVPKGQDGLVRKPAPQQPKSGPAWHYTKSFSDWCNHTPDTANPPIFSDGKVSLWIADAPGARKSKDMFDICIDGGNALDLPGEHDIPNLYGDPGLVRALGEHSFKLDSKPYTGPKILKIRWMDRCPPPCYPSFWPAMNDYLHKLAEKKKDGPLKVLTICQGGHGRSGSALVALTMCMTDYTPLEALTHIRALHCARAIESKDQHVYLNHLAEHLGREQNALEAENVKSFKDRFLLSTNPFAEPYKDRVKAGKGALVQERDGGYL